LLEQLGVHALPMTYERAFWVDVFEWLAKYGDHDPDWADGCLAVLSGRDKHLKIWTYDREFRSKWRRPNGTALPLAFK
jgi:predicted nucleic acid-binding protein